MTGRNGGSPYLLKLPFEDWSYHMVLLTHCAKTMEHARLQHLQEACRALGVG